jgi:hypothetical protein
MTIFIGVDPAYRLGKENEGQNEGTWLLGL